MKNCISVIAYRPHEIWLEFLQTIKEYDVYLVIDDNTENYNKKYGWKYPKINFIQIANEECEKNGFMNSSTIMGFNKVIGWDKALYYFSNINLNYNQIWFMEDDVYIYSEETLIEIDKKYSNNEVLFRKYCINEHGKKRFWNWHWRKIDIAFAPPYYNSMICATRTSKCLLSVIDKYAKENHTLFFIEALIPTLTHKHKIQHNTALELENIVYRKKWSVKNINKTELFHPVKNIELHETFRSGK